MFGKKRISDDAVKASYKMSHTINREGIPFLIDGVAGTEDAEVRTKYAEELKGLYERSNELEGDSFDWAYEVHGAHEMRKGIRIGAVANMAGIAVGLAVTKIVMPAVKKLLKK